MCRPERERDGWQIDISLEPTCEDGHKSVATPTDGQHLPPATVTLCAYATGLVVDVDPTQTSI